MVCSDLVFHCWGGAANTNNAWCGSLSLYTALLCRVLATPDTVRGEQTQLISHILPPAAVISALESSSSSAESREQRSRVWKWATKLSTGHSDDACGVVTSCHDTFQPFLLRTDGDNNSHDLVIFQPSPKCGTKLPTILRVQLQNCQVR